MGNLHIYVKNLWFSFWCIVKYVFTRVMLWRDEQMSNNRHTFTYFWVPIDLWNIHTSSVGLTQYGDALCLVLIFDICFIHISVGRHKESQVVVRR